MKSKYTILIMRDDTQARHMRFSPVWIKIFLWFILILVLLAAAGIWGTHYFWDKGRAQESRLVHLERQNAELNIKLERLQNMESLIGASENAIMPVVDSGPADSTPADEVMPGSVDLTALPGLVDAVANSTDTNSTGENPENVEPMADGSGAPNPDNSPVRLENINLRVNSPKTLRLSVDFVNVVGRQIRGHATLDLITSSGEVSAVVPTQDLDFVMARMKRGTTTFPLPEGVNMADVEKVRLTVHVNEEVVLIQEVPLVTATE